MFLDPKKYLLTIKEKDVHVQGKDIRKDFFQIILLNFNDIKSLSQMNKEDFKNKELEGSVAQSVIVIKSFDMEVSYICYWSYDTLNAKIKELLGEDGSLDKYYNLYIACKRTAIDTNVILDSDDFLNLFASRLKDKFILDIGNFKEE